MFKLAKVMAPSLIYIDEIEKVSLTRNMASWQTGSKGWHVTATLAHSCKCLHAASVEPCYLLIVEDHTSVMTSGMRSVCAKLSTGLRCKCLHPTPHGVQFCGMSTCTKQEGLQNSV